MANPKGNPQNLRTPSTKEARNMQRKSAKKRSENVKEKKLIKEMLEKRLGIKDLEEMCDNLIARAKENSRDFETFQAAMGQKPREEVEIGNLDDKPLEFMDMSKLTDEQLRAILSKKL